jgi:hypothetical protein
VNLWQEQELVIGTMRDDHASVPNRVEVEEASCVVVDDFHGLDSTGP